MCDGEQSTVDYFDDDLDVVVDKPTDSVSLFYLAVWCAHSMRKDAVTDFTNMSA